MRPSRPRTSLLPDVDADRLLEYMRERRGEMEADLRRMAEAESPTFEPERQEPVFDQLTEGLAMAELETRRFEGDVSGGVMLAAPRHRERGRPYQLVLGHSDTVWPVGTLEEMPVVVEDGKMRGPGVFDMKGGLVQMIYALRALHDLELEPRVAPVVFINSDEEESSQDSIRHIERLARYADRAFVLEPGLGPRGKLKNARKGTGRFTIRVSGVRAHSGVEPEAGASAILALSRVVQQLHDASDPDRGATLNVGLIEGGQRANVVAPQSEARVDARTTSREDVEWLWEQLESLETGVPGTELEIEGGFNRPTMEPTEGNNALWRAAREVGEELGLDLEVGMSGGASDGNNAAKYVPTLDGLGAVGGGSHAPHEHVVLDAMPERAALLALMLLLPPTEELL
ncbi:MAG: M20 family metallopeptidase [Gemmatimonadota bacterium]